MLAEFQKFDQFVADQANGLHNLGADTLRILLTNEPPAKTAKTLADVKEIAAGNGYEAGGPQVTVTRSSQIGGVHRLLAKNLQLRAKGGGIAPFQHAVLYNSDSGALIGWWSYAEPVKLSIGGLWTIDLESNGILTQT